MEIEKGRTIEMQGRRVKCKQERDRERNGYQNMAPKLLQQ
jgi:hypothetical protein